MNWKRVLLVSAALNLTLATACWMKRAPVAAPSPEPNLIAQTPPTKHGVRIVTNFVERTIEVADGEVRWPRWRKLAAEDFREFRTNLLTIGCPGDIARDILEFSMNSQHFAERRSLHCTA